MLIFKCKMCGGDIHALDGATHGNCDSCGTSSALPKANEERENALNSIRTFRDGDLKKWHEYADSMQDKFNNWKSRGLCRHCGGKIGVFGKCKVCKKETTYAYYANRPALSPVPHFTVLMDGYEWRVLDVKNDKALLLSDKVIDKMPYSKNKTVRMWEKCSLRNYLNGEFYSKLTVMKDFIAETEIDNGRYYSDTKFFQDDKTTDKVFLLCWDEDELVRYLNSAHDKIAKDIAGTASDWWCRSKGRSLNYIESDGSWNSHYLKAPDPTRNLGVRPALWLNME